MFSRVVQLCVWGNHSKGQADFVTVVGCVLGAYLIHLMHCCFHLLIWKEVDKTNEFKVHVKWCWNTNSRGTRLQSSFLKWMLLRQRQMQLRFAFLVGCSGVVLFICLLLKGVVILGDVLGTLVDDCQACTAGRSPDCPCPSAGCRGRWGGGQGCLVPDLAGSGRFCKGLTTGFSRASVRVVMHLGMLWEGRTCWTNAGRAEKHKCGKAEEPSAEAAAAAGLCFLMGAPAPGEGPR